MNIDYHLCLAILKEGERESIIPADRQVILSLINNKIVFAPTNQQQVQRLPLPHLMIRIQLLHFYQHCN